MTLLLLGAGWSSAAAAPQDAGTASSDQPSVNKSPDGSIDSTQAVTGLQVTLDIPQTLLGPTWKIDTHFNTLGLMPNIIGYVSNTNTWAYSTTDLQNFTLLPGYSLQQGQPGNFDACGVWLNSTYRDGTVVRGWYHAEAHPSSCSASPSLKSVGYVESYDGGITFVKPSYPNNKVISAPARYTDPSQASEGDSHVLRVGDYLLMYFVTPRDNYKIHLARSLVSDGGRPGTWWKYYNGSFSQPGLGGESSPLASGSVLSRAWIVYNTALGEFMGFSWSPTGFGISLSPDGINWRKVTGDILITNHEFHNRGPESGELIDYASIIGLDGDPFTSGTDSWLYYMRVPAGQPMEGNTRYLVRQRMHIVNGYASPTPTLAATSTASPTNEPTATGTPTATSSSTRTSTATDTATETPTVIATSTPPSKATDTSTPMPSNTPALTPSQTSTTAPMLTHTPLATATSIRTATRTPTRAATATVTKYTFTPQMDARIEEANPTRNYGRDGYLRTNGGSEPKVESYLRFSVSGLSGTVQSAKLRVYSYNGTSNGPAAYSTNSNWTETGITWSNRPPKGTTAYDDKGALGTNTWVEFNVTPMITGNGTYNLVLSQNSVDGFYFHSREGANRPQLYITTRP